MCICAGVTVSVGVPVRVYTTPLARDVNANSYNNNYFGGALSHRCAGAADAVPRENRFSTVQQLPAGAPSKSFC
ncbi:hypothetical protein EVAR_16626_1 [Eumeta japonica]|uniref:Uncharacterized protein n=1 Tax=Eumeta variegata TaxID=151549 RepID=A0A4C1V0U1_EUMVA|nr:hypothetical protein EVAR_16626_1 [Eumeta japonica]